MNSSSYPSSYVLGATQGFRKVSSSNDLRKYIDLVFLNLIVSYMWTQSFINSSSSFILVKQTLDIIIFFMPE